jgi:FAD/FMN-containing dehydrogenase
MSKIADYLQDHIVGDVSISEQARTIYANDASILSEVPQVVVAPKNEQDLRKIARFSWQLAERGRIVPIVARGSGTDMSGAAIGQTISIAMTQYMNRVIEFDDKKNIVTVEPGANFGFLQHMLSFSHGRYIPAYPSSYQYSTIGGAVANNAGGERSTRFGAMNSYVESLRVVLANGEVIETGRISKREANKRMGKATFEGELYRAIDGLLQDKEHAIKDYVVGSRSNAGYNIFDVREKDGSIDLTPLFVGSQGTLGIIQEMTLSTESYNSKVSSFIIVSKDPVTLQSVLDYLQKEKLLSCELFDRGVLELARKVHGSLFSEEVGNDLPAVLLLIEKERMSTKAEKKFMAKFGKLFNSDVANIFSTTEGDAVEVASKLRRLPQILLTKQFEGRQLVTGIDDASVPVGAYAAFLAEADAYFTKENIMTICTGHALEGIVHTYPLMDLSQLGDRQRIMRIIDSYYELVLRHGGSVTAEHGEGRIRASFVQQQLGDVMYDVMKQIKQMFDPFGILNPGVKFGIDQKALTKNVRQSFDIPQLYK